MLRRLSHDSDRKEARGHARRYIIAPSLVPVASRFTKELVMGDAAHGGLKSHEASRRTINKILYNV